MPKKTIYSIYKFTILLHNVYFLNLLLVNTTIGYVSVFLLYYSLQCSEEIQQSTTKDTKVMIQSRKNTE